MQPYFFPYLGYFDLIDYADKWVVFDTAQYIRHGWVNRNRIFHPEKESHYIIVPLRKAPRETPIKDMVIANDWPWRERIIGQLQEYRRAPNFTEVMALVKDCLIEEDSISRLNTFILAKVCAYLGVDFDYSVFSEMGLKLGPIEGPGDWALRIAESMGADEYVNAPGGKDLFDAEAFEKSGIKLTILETRPGLSIIDELMWHEIKRR